MSLITREGKGSKLTIQEMDGNLLYLQSLSGSTSQSGTSGTSGYPGINGTSGINGSNGTSGINGSNGTSGINGSNGTSGTNYIQIQGNGTDSQNAIEFQSAYNAAKLIAGLSSTNRVKLVVSPGFYTFGTPFIVDTQYIDIVSLTGDLDVIFDGINVTANDVYIKGVNCDRYTFTTDISSSLNLLKLENCKGGDYSFGSGNGAFSGTATNCIGGDYSFGSGYNSTFSGIATNCTVGDYSFGGGYGYGGTFSGIATNCIGGSDSFGGAYYGTFSGTATNCIGGVASFGGGTFSGIATNCIGGSASFGGDYGIFSGIATNCTGGDYSFGSGDGYGTFSGIATNCTGGDYSFGGGGGSTFSGTGRIYYCRITSGTFPTPGTGGRQILCIDGTNSIITV